MSITTAIANLRIAFETEGLAPPQAIYIGDSLDTRLWFRQWAQSLVFRRNDVNPLDDVKQFSICGINIILGDAP